MAFYSHAPSSSRFLTPRRKAAAAGVFALAAAGFILSLVGRTATVEFTLLVGGLFALCGIFCYDIFGRRLWEKSLSARIDSLSRTTDRLTRETGRNRVDIAALRDGLAETAAAAARERTMGIAAPERSRDAVQDRTIKTILEHLAVLRSAPPRPMPDDSSSAPPSPQTAAPPSPDHAVQWTPAHAANQSPVPLTASAAPAEDGLSDTVVRELVRHTLREGAIDVFLQPVVALPQRKPRFYEVFGRIRARSDLYLPAVRYMDFVRTEGAGPEIDTLVLLRVFERLRDSGPESADMPLMLNVSRTTLKDKGFMGDLILFLTNYHSLARRIVFEMPLHEFLAEDIVLEKVIGALTKLGCRFSADHVETLDLDPQALRARSITFLKLDAHRILSEGARHNGIGRIVALRKALEESGISLIATGIETERDLRELLDTAIAFGQGHLFGKPLPPGLQAPARPSGAEPKSGPARPSAPTLRTGTPAPRRRAVSASRGRIA